MRPKTTLITPIMFMLGSIGWFKLPLVVEYPNSDVLFVKHYNPLLLLSIHKLFSLFLDEKLLPGSVDPFIKQYYLYG